jgi:hypothetical protein
LWRLLKLLPALLFLLAAPVSAGQVDVAAREQLVIALERMIATGEPHHGTHDEGDVLQRALDRALQQQDPELELLATRAAVSIVATVTRPIVTSDEGAPIRIAAQVALKLPRPVRYAAEIFCSFDGAPPVFLGIVEQGRESFDINRALPVFSRVMGPHHVRVWARVVFQGSDGGPVPEPEWRVLEELAYAVYERELDHPADARLFIYSPGHVSARHFDRLLPDMPFEYWLNTVITSRGAEPVDPLHWSGHFCTDRTQEPGTPPARRDLCAVLHFQVGYMVWQIWIRTGRITFTEDSVHWLATPPEFEALRLVQPQGFETSALSALESFLDGSAQEWPTPDASIAPEDIVITPAAGKRNIVSVAATFRNKGQTNLYGTYIEIIAGDFGEPSTIRRFLRDIPGNGSVRIEVEAAVPKGYGIALFQIIPALSDYSPWNSPPEEPTPDDLLAYRFINPHLAPARTLASLKSQLCTAVKCRGY